MAFAFQSAPPLRLAGFELGAANTQTHTQTQTAAGARTPQTPTEAHPTLPLILTPTELPPSTETISFEGARAFSVAGSPFTYVTSVRYKGESGIMTIRVNYNLQFVHRSKPRVIKAGGVGMIATLPHKRAERGGEEKTVDVELITVCPDKTRVVRLPQVVHGSVIPGRDNAELGEKAGAWVRTIHIEARQKREQRKKELAEWQSKQRTGLRSEKKGGGLGGTQNEGEKGKPKETEQKTGGKKPNDAMTEKEKEKEKDKGKDKDKKGGKKDKHKKKKTKKKKRTSKGKTAGKQNEGKTEGKKTEKDRDKDRDKEKDRGGESDDDMRTSSDDENSSGSSSGYSGSESDSESESESTHTHKHKGHKHGHARRRGAKRKRRSHTHTHTHAHAHKHGQTPHKHAHSRSHAHTHSHKRSRSRSCSTSDSDSEAHKHTHKRHKHTRSASVGRALPVLVLPPQTLSSLSAPAAAGPLSSLGTIRLRVF